MSFFDTACWGIFFINLLCWGVAFLGIRRDGGALDLYVRVNMFLVAIAVSFFSYLFYHALDSNRESFYFLF